MMAAAFRRIFFAAIIGGLVAGILLSGIQAFRVLPLVWQAEKYEAMAPSRQGAVQSNRESPLAAAEWQPADGLGRFFHTVLFNILSGIGFALVLAAALAMRGNPDWREGLLWGAGGFVAFSLAPALNIPPVLPGMMPGDVATRQLLWAVTGIATASGLGLVVFFRRPAIKGAGAILIAAPLVFGEALVDFSQAGPVPAELAASFVSATLAASLLFWLAMGGCSGYVFSRLSASHGSSRNQ